MQAEQALATDFVAQYSSEKKVAWLPGAGLNTSRASVRNLTQGQEPFGLLGILGKFTEETKETQEYVY